MKSVTLAVTIPARLHTVGQVHDQHCCYVYTQKNIPWYRQGKNSLSKIPFISRDSFPLCSREISFSSKGIDPYVWMVGNFCFFVAGKSLFKGTIPLIIPYLTGKLLVGISSPWNRIPLAAGNLHWGQKWRNIPLFFTSKQGNIFLSVSWTSKFFVWSS